jgi:tRNA nucleotidyltransferase (CCA-adding enzyme)
MSTFYFIALEYCRDSTILLLEPEDRVINRRLAYRPATDLMDSEKVMRTINTRRELYQSILKRIVPDESEREEVKAFCLRIEREFTGRLRDAGLRAVAEIHGSVARDTWIKGERDVDVFIVLDTDYDRDVFPKVLDVIKDYVGEGWVEAYAEHPYIRAQVDGFNVEFVPCFRFDERNGLKSATDRTPLHTVFVNEHLIQECRDQVRLLKKFMKGIGVYGAEVKIGGFSGYLCELLVIHHHSFDAVLEEASTWSRGEVLDLMGSADVRALRKRFKEPLIVVDPVDARRNVASAVSNTAMWTFTAAARAFLRKPATTFFYPERAPVVTRNLLEQIRGHGLSLLFVVVEDRCADVPDVLWGQLYKAEKVLSDRLGKTGFQVFRSAVWSNEVSKHIFVFELESDSLPGIMKRKGPPVEMAENSMQFIEAHLGVETTILGPWIEGNRWWVGLKRPEPSARGLVASLLRDGGRDIGISRRLGEKIKQGHEVLMGDEVGGFLDAGFADFLDHFLRGRPGWLG